MLDEQVDLICHLIDAPHALSALGRTGSAMAGDEQMVLSEILERAPETPRYLVLNKIDRVADKGQLLPIIESLTSMASWTEIVPVSAINGENVDVLIDLMLSAMPVEEALLFPQDMITDQAERFIAAEFIRERLMLVTNKEIPYSLAVEVESMEDAPRKNLLHVSAVIHVERDSQKGIVIGKGGERLKRVGTEARQEMERFFGKKVFLELFVRVQEGWSEDARSLKRFGYE